MDLTSIKTIREIQNKFSFTFKKGLGQNFLTDPSVIEKIADSSDCTDGVLEIGPGFGVLTAALAERAPKVAALEIDPRLTEVLGYTLAEFDNVKIINADVMKTDLAALIRNEFGDKKISVAANLPYYITTPVITRLIEERLPLKSITVMIQKEVADRLCAKEGSKDYGAISVLCAYYTKPEIITRVSASKFVPPPKVDSAVLKMTICSEPNACVKSEKYLFRTVKAAFSQRRKTLLNCLSSFFGSDKQTLTALLDDAGIAPSRRGETLSLAEFARLSDIIFEHFEKQ